MNPLFLAIESPNQIHHPLPFSLSVSTVGKAVVETKPNATLTIRDWASSQIFDGIAPVDSNSSFPKDTSTNCRIL